MTVVINRNTRIKWDASQWNKPVCVSKAVVRLEEDLRRVIVGRSSKSNQIEEYSWIEIEQNETLDAEGYRIDSASESTLVIQAKDVLGLYYALNELAEVDFHIPPFFFWMDTPLDKRDEIVIDNLPRESKAYDFRFRGWFINDEVLLDQWEIQHSNDAVWERVFETIIRCGGNMVIPGTDENAAAHAQIASDMGLWISHHHAEPLGAEMFARAFPKLEPSYDAYPDKFESLWEEAVIRQKDHKVLWNLGFRGQGDYPFWENDPRYDTDAKRGALISQIMMKQYGLIAKHIEEPVCCTNLYGEILELYRGGHLTIDPSIIKIWADNGYGKMVSRRQGNHNPRIEALASEQETQDGSAHGIYYHVSFYDLQAANHITMLPNTIEFMNGELETVLEAKMNDYIIVNGSNVKPHIYHLDAIAKIWKGQQMDDAAQSKSFMNTYFNTLSQEQKRTLQQCLEDYFDACLPFGMLEDEKAGEQLYTYTTRSLITGYTANSPQIQSNGIEDLYWLTGKVGLKEQVDVIKGICAGGVKGWSILSQQLEALMEEVSKEAAKAIQQWLYLQVQLHKKGCEGTLRFCEALDDLEDGDGMEAFYKVGEASECFEEADELMKKVSTGVWEGFYDNECLSDYKFSGYQLKRFLSYIRWRYDGPHFYMWQRKVIYSEADAGVILLTNKENHLTDEELYLAIKDKKMLK